MQAIALARNIPLPVVDVRSASDDEIARLIREEGQARFDLAHGPLLRVKLLQRAHKSFIF